MDSVRKLLQFSPSGENMEGLSSPLPLAPPSTESGSSPVFGDNVIESSTLDSLAPPPVKCAKFTPVSVDMEGSQESMSIDSRKEPVPSRTSSQIKDPIQRMLNFRDESIVDEHLKITGKMDIGKDNLTISGTTKTKLENEIFEVSGTMATTSDTDKDLFLVKLRIDRTRKTDLINDMRSINNSIVKTDKMRIRYMENENKLFEIDHERAMTKLELENLERPSVVFENLEFYHCDNHFCDVFGATEPLHMFSNDPCLESEQNCRYLRFLYHCSQQFTEDEFRSALKFELNRMAVSINFLTQIMDHSGDEIELLRSKLKSNPVVIFCRYLMIDSDVTTIAGQNSASLIRFIYLINNFVYNTDIPDQWKYDAQSDEDENVENETFLMSILAKIRNIFSGASDLVTKIEQAIEKILGFLKSILSYVTEHVTIFIDTIRKYFADMIVSFIDIKSVGASVWTYLTEHPQIVQSFIIVTGLCVLAVSGLVSHFFVARVLQKLCGIIVPNPENEAQGVECMPGMLVGVTTWMLGGLGDSSMNTLVKTARNLTALVAGGTVMYKVFEYLLSFLPQTFKHGLILKFGTADNKARVKFDYWYVDAQSLLRMSRVPQVLVTDRFQKLLLSSVNDGIYMIRKIKDIHLRNLMSQTLIPLMKIQQTIEQFNSSSASRKVPYCLHLYGLPGSGKSLSAPRLIRDISGYEGSSVYARPIYDEYWSGFTGQKAVLIDEHIIGCENAEVRAKEYLQLVSPTTFRPNMPSNDNIHVGIKGIEGAPDIVLTANNERLLPHIAGVNRDALNRRRNVVVHVKIRDDAHRVKGNPNNANMAKYSQSEKDDLVWIEYAMGAPDGPNANQSKWMNYYQLVDLLRKDYEEHHEIQNSLLVGQNNAGNKASPDDIMDSILRDNYGLPRSQGFDIISYILGGPAQSLQNYGGSAVHEAQGGGYRAAKKLRSKPKQSVTQPTTSHSEITTRTIVRPVSSQSVESQALDHGPYFCSIIPEKFSDNTSTTSDDSFHDVNPNFDYKEYQRQFACDLGYDEEMKKKFPSDVQRVNKEIHPPRDLSDAELSQFFARTPVSCSSHTATLSPNGHVFTVPKGMRHGHQCAFRYTNINEDEPTTYFSCPNVIYHVNQEHGLEYCKDHNKPFYRNNTCYYIFSKESPYLPVTPWYDEMSDDPVEPIYKRACESQTEYTDRVLQMFSDTIKAPFHVWNNVIVRQICDDYDIDMNTASSLTSSNIYKCAALGGMLIGGSLALIVHGIRKLFLGSNETAHLTFEPPNEAQVSPTGGEGRDERKSKKRGKIRHKIRRFDAHGTLSATPQATITFGGSMDGHKVDGVYLNGDNFLCVYHCLCKYDSSEVIDSGTPITMYYQGKNYDAGVFNLSSLRVDDDYDIAVFSISGRTIPRAPNLSKKFWTDMEHATFVDERRTGIAHGEYRDGENMQAPRVQKCGTLIAKDATEYSRRCGIVYKLPTHLQLLVQGRSGNCGTPIMADSGNIAGKFIGLHVAGSTNAIARPYSIISPVTKEKIDTLLQYGTFDDIDLEETTDLMAQGIEEDRVMESQAFRESRISFVPVSERIFMNRKSKITIAPGAEDIPELANLDKEPAILSANDTRGNGTDPVINGMLETMEETTTELDEQLCMAIEDEIYLMFSKPLQSHNGYRLTFEQAILGIPGRLSSLNLGTSPGWPLIQFGEHGGKRSFLSISETGQLKYAPFVRDLVDSYLESMSNGDRIPHKFIGYLKDELVPHRKIVENRTRLIFANDLIALIAFRMVFGYLLMRINETKSETPSALGYNQYSYDMHDMYMYLANWPETRYIAGDYKHFDRKVHPRIQKLAYNVFGRLASDYGVTQNEFEVMRAHETESPAQMGKWLFNPKTNHMSGCFLTTPINNFVNIAYIMYVFRRKFPHLKFNDYMRVKVLGDDHVIGVNPQLELDPSELVVRMQELGQTYTSADKVSQLAYQNFEDITFLGAHPTRAGDGRWVGRLRKDSIYQLLKFRHANASPVEYYNAALEYSSMWETDFYERVKQIVRELERDEEYPVSGPDESQMSLALRVAARTAATGVGFYAQSYRLGPKYWMPPEGSHPIYAINDLLPHHRMVPQKPPSTWETESQYITLQHKRPNMKSKPRDSYSALAHSGRSSHYPDEYIYYRPSDEYNKLPGRIIHEAQSGESFVGLTGIHQTNPTEDGKTGHDQLTKLSLTVDQGHINYGNEGWIYRETIDWQDSAVAGTSLKVWKIPFELLDLGNPENLQNYNFDRYTYWNGDVEILFQITGQPFQQGLLIAYFYPLSSEAGELSRINTTACEEYVFLTPNMSTSATLRIPFRFPRSVLNTFAFAMDDMEVIRDPRESLGTLCLKVFSPLQSTNANDSCQVSIYSKFPGSSSDSNTSNDQSAFYCPRPVSTQTVTDKLDNVKKFRQHVLEGLPTVPTKMEHNIRTFKEPCSQQNLSTAMQPASLESIPENEAQSSEFIPRGRPITPILLPLLQHEAQGMGSSKEQGNTYNIHDIAGPLTIEQGAVSNTGPTQRIAPKTQLAAGEGVSSSAAMSGPSNDNPPLPSGGFPTYQQFSGMSATSGIEPTVALDQHPNRQTRTGQAYFEGDSHHEYMSNRWCLFFESDWNVGDPQETTIREIRLDSMLGLGSTVVPGGSTPECPANLIPMNAYMFWRANICLKLVVVKTNYHSGRLRVMTAYGAPSFGTGGSQTHFNEVPNFEANDVTGLSVATFMIPYNAATQYIRTFEGDGVVDLIQDYSLGFARIEVANALKASSTAVPQTVKVLIFAKFQDVSFVCPRPVPFINVTNIFGSDPKSDMNVFTQYQYQPPVPPAIEEFEDDGLEAQSGDGTMITPSENQPDEDLDGAPIDVSLTKQTEAPLVPHQSCRLRIGHHFEYSPQTIEELGRRHMLLPPEIYGSENSEYATIFPMTDQYVDSSGITSANPITIPVYPHNYFTNFFAAWVGSIKYRIFSYGVSGSNQTKVMYSPFTQKPPEQSNPNNPDQTEIISCSTVLGRPLTHNTSNASWGTLVTDLVGLAPPLIAKEQSFHTGNQGFADYSVPFESHYYFMINPTGRIADESYVSVTGRDLGLLYVSTPRNGTTAAEIDTSNVSIYTALGDDFRYGIYRPPLRLRILPFFGTGLIPTSGAVLNLNGWHIVNDDMP